MDSAPVLALPIEIVPAVTEFSSFCVSPSARLPLRTSFPPRFTPVPADRVAKATVPEAAEILPFMSIETLSAVRVRGQSLQLQQADASRPGRFKPDFTKPGFARKPHRKGAAKPKRR